MRRSRIRPGRLPEGLPGIRALHDVVASHAEAHAGAHAVDPARVVVDIETDRGLWVNALATARCRATTMNAWRSSSGIPSRGMCVLMNLRCRRAASWASTSSRGVLGSAICLAIGDSHRLYLLSKFVIAPGRTSS